MDLAPHLYVLPLELTPFMELLAALGAQEAFSAAQYTTVLQVSKYGCRCGCWPCTKLTGNLVVSALPCPLAGLYTVLMQPLSVLSIHLQDLATDAAGKPLQPKQVDSQLC